MVQGANSERIKQETSRARYVCTDTEKEELIQVCDCGERVRQGSGKGFKYPARFLIGYGCTVPTQKEAGETV